MAYICCKCSQWLLSVKRKSSILIHYKIGIEALNEKPLELSEATSAIPTQILPEDHPDNSVYMGNLAATYSHLGVNDKALELFETALAIQIIILPDNDPDIASTKGNQDE